MRFVLVLFRTFSRAAALQNLAGALLPERVNLLGAEPNQQAVLPFMLRDVLDDVGHGLRDRHALNRCLPAELLVDGPLLL